MIGLRLDQSTNASCRILCLGAHADDIEIGCGGTLMQLVAAYPESVVRWVVFSAGAERAAEARACADRFLAGAHNPDVRIASFRDGFFPYEGAAVKEFFEQELRPFAPDLIFTHHEHDGHQDHRTLSELTWNTFRDHLILEYEIPKYDGDLGRPNVFVPLDEATCRQKVEYLMDGFTSQQAKPWFSEETFYALLRLRGIESRHRYAEAFHCRKVLLR